MKPLVISLCDRSCVAVEDWALNGYECWCIDIEHECGVGMDIDGIRQIGCDVRNMTIPRHREIAFVSAFPPCTHLAVSGARWFKGKGLKKLAEAIELVAVCVDICIESGAPYYIENPISTLSTYWRVPDYRFDPCDYAGYLDDPGENAYTKKTCLWTGGGFVMPEKKRFAPVYGSIMHYIPPSKDREYLRSITPRGFARAVFQSNGKHIGETSIK